MRIAFALLAAAIALAGVCSAQSSSITVVDFTVLKTQDQLAVQACAGLMNRNVAVAGPVFTFQSAYDKQWLADIEGLVNPPLTPLAPFLRQCLRTFNATILYSYASQQATLPLLVTLAGVLNAVPLEVGSPYAAGVPVAFDATKSFAGLALVNATALLFDRYASQTTALAFLNPGTDAHRFIFVFSHQMAELRPHC